MAIVGTRATRLDVRDKLTGQARYGTELRVPGMLHGLVLRSALPHARISRLDVSGPQALDGVVVATAADAPHLYGYPYREQTVFAFDRVRYVGQPIAAVAAETPELVRRALALIEVDYEPLPALFDPAKALLPEAPLLHENLASYEGPPDPHRRGNVCARVVFARGDVERALADADVVVESTYTTAAVHQSPMEPHAALAQVDPDGRVSVWASTQAPFELRRALAEILRVPPEQVRVVATCVGGGFGCKISPVVEHVCVVLARKSGRPVRMVHSREEELAYGTPRRPQRITLVSGVRHDGTLLARRVSVLQDAGAFTGESPELASVAAHLATGPYRVPDARVEVVAAHTNSGVYASYRGPGGPQMVFAVESHMDAIARTLRMDPLELRLKSAWQDGDRALNGQVIRDPGLREAIERAADAIGWNAPRALNRGKGLACGWWCTVGGPASVELRLDDDGLLRVISGAAEIGTGSTTALAQFAADAMRVPLERVRLTIPDTDSAPYDAGALGSRTTFNQGNAARLAAIELERRMRVLAGRLLEVAADDVELVDGRVQVQGAPTRSLTYRELARAARESGEPLVGSATYNAPETPHDPSAVGNAILPTWSSPSYFCHAAEVEVDPETGAVRVLNYVAAHDVGKVVNPTLVEGQIQGGVVQGYGMALTEELRQEDGVVTTRDWSLYKLPTTLEAPRARIILLEHPDADGPLGAKGTGEAPVVPPPAAIANAVADAIGAPVTSLPISPEAVSRALEARR